MDIGFFGIVILGAALFLLPVGYFVWLFALYRVPPTAGGTVVTEFVPPEEIGPAEAAFLIDGSLKPRAMAAMLVDLHLRSFIEIEEVGGVVMALRRKAAAVGALASYEKIFLMTVFSAPGSRAGAGSVGPAFGGGTDERVTMAQASGRLKDQAKLISAGLSGTLREKKIFAEKGIVMPILVGAAVIAALMLQLALVPVIGFFGALIVFLVLVLLSQMAYIAATWRPRLTDRGRRLYWQLLGFRTYLKTAEADRLRWEESEKRKMNRFLPYAIVFDLSLSWATKLQPLTDAFLERL